MDLGTLIGTIVSFAIILVSAIMGGTFADFIGAFVNVPSLILVVAGTITVTLIMFPLGTLKGIGKVVMKSFFFKPEQPHMIIEQIVQLSDKARRESIVALEKVSVSNPFLARGIQLVADGTEQGLLRNIMDIDLSITKQRHWRGQDILRTMGTYSPAFGMMGTLIGLVQMLRNMDDPNSIGPAMAVALLTTLYGAVLANVFFNPLAKKLEERSNEEFRNLELIREGILSIQKGEHPALLKEKLQSFQPPSLRAKR